MSRRRPAPAPRKRVKVVDAVSLLGIEARTVRDMAQRGEIPGAAKPRGVWTFDLALLEQFTQDCERAACQRASEGRRLREVVSGEAKPSTAGFRPQVETSSGRCAQVILRLRAAAARRNVSAR
jgi:hypothetical protein